MLQYSDLNKNNNMEYYNYPEVKNENVIVKQEKVNTKKVIYLGGLPPDVDKYELNQFIMSQGDFNIEELMIPNKKNYAYVKFKTKEEALLALKVLQSKEFKKYIINAQPFHSSKQKKRIDSNLFVKNLKKDCTPKDLFELFSKYGTVDSIDLRTGPNGDCLGFACVDFTTEESAKEAMENLNQTTFQDNIITVTKFTPKEQRVENSWKNQNLMPMIVVLKIENDLNSKGLKSIFEIYGQIMLGGIINESPLFLTEKRDDLSEINKYGIILYSKKEEALEAFKNLKTKYDLVLTEMDETIIEKVKKEKHDFMKAKYEGANLVVKNLPKEINDKALFDIFKKYGPIVSARVQTEGKMKDIKDDQGNIIDKSYVYESKGFAFVLYKNVEDAQKAKAELNDFLWESNGIKIKLIIEDFDYDKGKIENLQRDMGYRGGHIRGYPHNRGDMRGRGRGFIQRGHPYNMNIRNNMMNYQNFMNNPQNMYPQANRITVEGADLMNKVIEKLKIENKDERTEAIGELLFYFLKDFIPQYGLNTTNGQMSDIDLCSKLTGILIKTESSNLLQIISTTEGLRSSLTDVLQKLIQTNIK